MVHIRGANQAMTHHIGAKHSSGHSGMGDGPDAKLPTLR